MEALPILKIGDHLLITIQVDLDDHRALALQEALADRIVATGVHGVLIDISALDIVDSFIGRMLASMASISRVLDAETVVAGMRPAVAITMAELGLTLGGARAALDVDRGMALLSRLIAGSASASGASAADEEGEAREVRDEREVRQNRDEREDREVRQAKSTEELSGRAG